MIARRALLAAAGGGLAAPALSQIRRNELEPLALPVKQDDTVARGYRRDVLVRWGDRVTFDAPRWAPRTPDPDAVAGQFGWDARVAGIAVPQQPASDGVPRAILAVVHPTVDPRMAFPGGADQPAAAAAMQGASLLNIEKQGGRWVVVDGGYQSRRLGGSTLCRVTGGAVGAVRGLLGLVGGCVTPWGTLLLAEGDPAFWQGRLGGLDPAFADGSGFGYVAELNPFDPQSVPVKRGRAGPLRPWRRGGDPGAGRPGGGLYDGPAGRRLPVPLRLGRPCHRRGWAGPRHAFCRAAGRRPGDLAAAAGGRRGGAAGDGAAGGRQPARLAGRVGAGPDGAAAAACLPRQPGPAGRAM